MNRRDELRAELRTSAKPYMSFRRGPDYEAIMKDLKEEFDRTQLVGPTEYDTVVRAAQRDVVRYIEMMCNFSEENDNVG